MKDPRDQVKRAMQQGKRKAMLLEVALADPQHPDHEKAKAELQRLRAESMMTPSSIVLTAKAAKNMQEGKRPFEGIGMMEICKGLLEPLGIEVQAIEDDQLEAIGEGPKVPFVLRNLAEAVQLEGLENETGENSLWRKLEAQGFEIFENSRPGGPFSIILKRGGHGASALARTAEEALQKAYDSFLLSLKKDP